MYAGFGGPFDAQRPTNFDAAGGAGAGNAQADTGPHR
jgi:hypothetical protein